MRPTITILLTLLSTTALAEPASDVERYCTAMRDDALEARYARLERGATAARDAIATERDALIARTGELREWVERREAFLALADEQLVAIYGAMRPDTAGEQLSLLSPLVGAAVLVRLKPRQASAVLAGMRTEKAAELAAIIAASREGEGQRQGDGDGDAS